MIKQNLHTHCTYCDGKDMPEEMILTAIDKGFDSIGFSSHSYMHWNGRGLLPESQKDYCTEIRDLAKKYKKIPHHVTVVRNLGSYFRPKRLLKRSTRPPVSTSFCLPV